MDDVVDFAKFRDEKQQMLQVPDLVFVVPQLYRIGGFEFDSTRTADTVIRVPSNRPIKPFYTLLPDRLYEHVAHQTNTPIDCLDPAFDSGWVIVRQHFDVDRALSYLHALRDTHDKTDRGVVQSIKPRKLEGVYTVLHRPATKGCLDHLLIYVSEYPGCEVLTMEERIGSPERYAIYHSDGTITYDPVIFYGS